MMKPLKPPVPWKRRWEIVVGLGLVAGASALFLRPSVSDSDLSGVGADAETAAWPTPAAPAAVGEHPVPPSADEASPAALAGSALAEYDARLSALTEAVRADRDAGAEARPRIPALLASTEPMDQVVGLAQMAGLGLLDAQADLARYRPEAVLAAVDLCASQFGEPAARSLLDQWKADLGGAQTAAEMAHNLLLEARLPYGGGSTALDLMIGVNEPSAIFVGLFEFAVDSRLPGAIRSEALIRLRDYVEPAAYPDHLRECVELAQEFGGDWLPRAQRLQTWIAAPAIDRAFLENALAAPAPGALEDLDLLLRHGGKSALDAETAAFLRSSLMDLDETAWSGPDQLARGRLLREIEASQSP
jgi:hypothetical protein